MEQIAARESKASVFFIGFFVTSSGNHTERGMTAMLRRIELLVKRLRVVWKIGSRSVETIVGS
jgi:hypothetical protein